MGPKVDGSAEPDCAPYALRSYAFVADGFRGALIDPDGGVAWMCFPSWADPAVFAELLGSGGSYRIVPDGRRVHGGYYEEGTLIWRNRWVTEDAIVETREALAFPGDPDRAVLLRRVIAAEGASTVRVRLRVASDYGRRGIGDWERQGDAWMASGADMQARWSGAAGAHGAGRRADGGSLEVVLRLDQGAQHDFVLELRRGAQGTWAEVPDPGVLWEQTESAWARAIPACTDMPSGRDVRRSFAVLRGMTGPSGGTVAAATTSLPERAQSGRNYDYRYVWLRDTCYIGHAGAAVAGAETVLDDAVRWVSERLIADGAQTMPAYTVDGQPIPDETTLGLPGYPGGSDVFGNRVRTQFQLDVFGEALLLLADAATVDRIDSNGWRAADIALDAIASRHTERDAGIWEIEPANWTHSRLICVAGLRRLAHASAPASWRDTALSLADRLQREAEREALHPSGRWQRATDDERVDASLLLAQVRGALSSDDPRSVATRNAVLDELCEDEFLYRYPHPGQRLGDVEGAFLVCNFWMVLALMSAGDEAGARQWFERTRMAMSSSGLFSEEYDVQQRQLRGNLPQAFVHALLIECAGTICAG